VALLDTGCLSGNWISSQLVERLQVESSVTPGAQKMMKAANGGEVKSQGTIELDWRWSLKGVKAHTTTFHVFDAAHHDIILGNEFLKNEGLLSWNEDNFSPLTEHDPVISPCELPTPFGKFELP
jgi:muconolactone delta-isomerase